MAIDGLFGFFFGRMVMALHDLYEARGKETTIWFRMMYGEG